MSPDVIVRDARPGDGEAMGKLGAMLVNEHHHFDPKRFIAPVPRLSERYGEFLVSRIGQPQMIVLVADLAGDVVGYCYSAMEGNDYMALRGPAGVIYDLVVDPAERRKGIGSGLINATFEALKKLGAPRVLLFTAEKNHVAQAMFEHSGFRRTMIEMTRELD
jgi:ribosomal protein S18 acetylase RimI-like enzyme